jgi:predicted amidophosphoribosyltransferase
MPAEDRDEEPEYCTVCGDPLSGAEAFCAGCGSPAHAHETAPESEEGDSAED